MEVRKPSQKLEMKKPPKQEIEILNEKFDSIDKKVEKILKLLKSK